MLKEIEVKILEVDRNAVIARLEELQATKSFDGEMLALFYDTLDGEIGQKGDLLRVRKEGKNTVLTYKKFVSVEGAKVMEEYETSIGDVNAIRSILDLLGFHTTKQTRKFRIQYELGDTHVVLDNYQDALAEIPEFIEIEGPNLTRIIEVAELLGFSEKDFKSWNTYDLVKYYLGPESV